MAITKDADLVAIAYDVQWGDPASGCKAIFASDYTFEDARTLNAMSREDFMEAIIHLALSDADLQARREWYDEEKGFADTDWVKVWRDCVEDSAACCARCDCSSNGVVLSDRTMVYPDDSGFIAGLVVETSAECAECGGSFKVKRDPELGGSWIV